MPMEITGSYHNYAANYAGEAKPKTSRAQQNAVQETTTASTSSPSQSESIAEGMKYLQELQKKYSNSYFGVGTVSYGQTAGKFSCVNFIVNPEYLSKLGTDEDAKKQFEEDVEYLYNYSQNLKTQKAASGWDVVSVGWFWDENGNEGGWIVTRKTDEKSFLQKMQEKSDEIRDTGIEKKQEQKKLAEKKAAKEEAEKSLKEHFGERFKGINVSYMTKAYSTFLKNQTVTPSSAKSMAEVISDKYAEAEKTENVTEAWKTETVSTSDVTMDEYKAYISDKISQMSMNPSRMQDSISIHISEAGFEAMKKDPEYEKWVLDYIQRDFMCYNPWASVCGGSYAVYNFEASKEEFHAEGWYAGYQNGNGKSIYEDKAEERETTTYGGWVAFNEGKRARQLAAAKTQANIQSLMGLLQADLEQCESGKDKGMCDDATISKVKKMIAAAQQKMGELSGKTEASPADEQAFLMAGFM